MVQSDRPKHSYLNPLSEDQAPGAALTAGGDEVCGGNPVLNRSLG